MSKKTKSVEKMRQAKDLEIIIQAFLAQYDALVNGLCDVCCISNYWNTQRTKIRDEARKLSPYALQSITGIRLYYDTTGQYDEGGEDKQPLFADSVFFIPYSSSDPANKYETLEWDGHLRQDLRGHW